MDSAQLGKAFTATVQASLHGLQSIEPVLQREQDALLGKDPETLQQVVREKLVLLKELEHSVHARDRLQKAAGLPAGNEGAGKLVEGLQQQALTQDWAALTETRAAGRRTQRPQWSTGDPGPSATHAPHWASSPDARQVTTPTAHCGARRRCGELYTRQGLTCGAICPSTITIIAVTDPPGSG
ncbi:MAG: flagellar protein FlgN [Chromatiaceae bacterium]|nr:flagellar protein FlgN [Chromatiaceae bacterium]